MLGYSWPMIPNALAMWVMNLSDRLIITAVMGVEANAVYAVANKIPNLFTTLQGTYIFAWQENASLSVGDMIRVITTVRYLIRRFPCWLE